MTYLLHKMTKGVLNVCCSFAILNKALSAFCKYYGGPLCVLCEIVDPFDFH